MQTVSKMLPRGRPDLRNSIDGGRIFSVLIYKLFSVVVPVFFCPSGVPPRTAGKQRFAEWS